MQMLQRRRIGVDATLARRGRSCAIRRRNQPLAPGIQDSSVDVLVDSCFTLDCVNTGKNNVTVSADPLVTGHWSLVTGHWSLVTGHWSLLTGGSSLRSRTRKTEYDVTGLDFTELAFTFHSDGERTRDSPFRAPIRCRTMFSNNLTRSRSSGDDDSNLGGATCDSADFRFTFHTESSQIHFDSVMRQ